MSVLLVSAYMKMMLTLRLEMLCVSGYSALMKTVMYGCIQTVWKTTMMTLFVVYVEQYVVTVLHSKRVDFYHYVLPAVYI